MRACGALRCGGECRNIFGDETGVPGTGQRMMIRLGVCLGIQTPEDSDVCAELPTMLENRQLCVL
jgi:hypothetical protein